MESDTNKIGFYVRQLLNWISNKNLFLINYPSLQQPILIGNSKLRPETFLEFRDDSSLFFRSRFLSCILLVGLVFVSCKASAQEQVKILAPKKEMAIPVTLKWSERMALSIMKRHPKAWQIDNHEKPKWDYKIGMILTGYEKLYTKTKNPKYFDYIKGYADELIDSNGSFQDFNPQDHNIDFINAGKILFNLYDKTQNQKYLTALKTLRRQFDGHPRTQSGGFWHKKIYPNQMWLDGLYMGEPFYARYTVAFEKGEKLNDVAHQFELLHDHAFDKKTGLFFHAWDESKQMAWANKETGTAPHIWLRALGWYAMALVDVLDYFPKEHPKHKELVRYLNEFAVAASKFQDKSGLWYQVPNLATKKGNYLEASGSSMLTYAFAKGVNKGYLSSKFKGVANKAFNGLTKKLIKVDADGEIHITQVCASAGLGGNPYRDGSYEYYISEKIKVDNSHGLGSFLLAAIELDK
ncbi:glycoside hydrolase family 88/105 protein [Flavobacterium sp. ZT3R25]|uniref:glycoside hydrolase family 88/105 protein n=1 Tax=Flavobacterium galactosi TaxID=3398735 RepID=UPI003A886D8F